MLLLRQNQETATEKEWDDLLSTLVSLRSELPKLKIIVRTDGGGPTVDQRHRLAEALSGTPARVAVVSDHLKVRFVTSTLALFQKDLKSFLVKEFPEAYEHVGATASESRQAELALKEMAAELA